MFGDLFSQRGTYVDGMFYRGHMKYLRDHTHGDKGSSFRPPDELRTRRQLRNAEHKSTNDHKQDNSTQPKNFNIKFEKKKDTDENHTRFKRAAHVVQDIILLEHFSSNQERDWVKRKEAGVTLWINKNTGEVATIQPWVESGSTKDVTRNAKMAFRHGTASNSSTYSRFDTLVNTETHRVSTARSMTEEKLQIPTRPNTVDYHSDAKHTRDSQIGHRDQRDHKQEHKPEQENEFGDAIDDESSEVELGTGALVYDRSEVDSFFAMLDELK